MDREPRLSKDDLKNIARGTQAEFQHLEAMRPLTIEEKANDIFQSIKDVLVEHFPDIKVFGDMYPRKRQVSPSEKVEYQQLRIRILIRDRDPNCKEVLQIAKKAMGGGVDERFSLEVKWVQEPAALIGEIDIHPIFSTLDDQR